MPVNINGDDGTSGGKDIPAFVERGFGMVKGFADEWDIQPYAQRWGGIGVEAFLQALKDGQGEDRLIAICALGSTREPRVKEIFLPYLESQDPKERWASALMLGEMKEERALMMLKKMLLEFLPSQPSPFAEQEKTDPLYDFWRPHVPRVLGNWQRPDLIPLFRQALTSLWDSAPKRAFPDKIYWFNCQDEIAYALGRLGAFSILPNLELPSYGLRLAMVQMAVGSLDIRSRFPYPYAAALFSLLMRNPTLTEEVISVLEQHVAFPRQERLLFLAEFGRAVRERDRLIDISIRE